MRDLVQNAVIKHMGFGGLRVFRSRISFCRGRQKRTPQAQPFHNANRLARILNDHQYEWYFEKLFVSLKKKIIMGLVLTNYTIDKYFGFLSRLDNSSKKKLIIKLTESIEDKKEVKISLKDLSGAWEDSRDSDKIISEIRNSRVDKLDNIEF